MRWALGLAILAITIPLGSCGPPPQPSRNSTVATAAPRPPAAAQGGLVRRNGARALVDDGGSIHPLCITFFWLLEGQTDRPDLLERNLAYLDGKVDCVRAVAEVDWDDAFHPGHPFVDRHDPGYEANLADALARLKAHHLRLELTVLASQRVDDAMQFVPRVARGLLTAPDAVLGIDMANEVNVVREADWSTLVDMARYFRAVTPLKLVAVGSNGGDNVGAAIRAASFRAGATYYVNHDERVDARIDAGWRNVASGWSFAGVPWACDNDEPSGPGSSVAEIDDPLQLALQRAVSVIAGCAVYTFHVGDMLSAIDQFDARSGRDFHDFIGEVPDIDADLRALRNVDRYLPDGVENWTKLAPGWTGFPFTLSPTAVFAFAARNAGRFLMAIGGVNASGIALTAHGHWHVDALDPTSDAPVASVDVADGQAFALPGRADLHAGYILRGRAIGPVPPAYVTPIVGAGTLGQWRQFFADLRGFYGLSGAASRESLRRLEPDLNAWGAALQRDEAGMVRARLILPPAPTTDTAATLAEPGRVVDVGPWEEGWGWRVVGDGGGD